MGEKSANLYIMAEANEAAVRPEDFLALFKSYKPVQAKAGESDTLSGHYKILLNQLLPELGSPVAKAYIVRDARTPDLPLYGLVFDNVIPYRQKNIAALKGFHHPNMVAFLDDGLVEISTLGEARYVAVLERPSGQPLSRLLAQSHTPVSEPSIIHYILRPLTNLLLALAELGVSHNRINLDTIYLNNEKLVVTDCISEPSGLSQDFLFEPIDRMLASVWAKPNTSISADCYAIAVVALNLALGFRPVAEMKKTELIESILAKGSYFTLAVQWDFSDTMQDFFRGLLNDVRRERWEPKQIEAWLIGRRFNLIQPSLPNEAPRPFEFLGQGYFNRKIIAYAMSTNWTEARATLGDTKLARWVETAAHRPEIADLLTNIARHSSADNARAERHNNDLLARALIILDPTDPIRFRHLCISIEGFGTIWAYAMLRDRQEDLQALAQFLESDLPAFWVEQQKIAIDYSNLLWKMQRARTYMRISTLGFGIERCLYDFNPDLACQSPLVKRSHATSLDDLLLALDAVAAQKSVSDDFMDRHIAGFIASKLDLGKEIRIQELSGVPQLAAHPRLVALKLLARAQQKAGEPVLKGLCFWVAMRLLPLADNLHRRGQRHTLQKDLYEAARSGSIQAVALILMDPDIFLSDYQQFQKAAENYAMRTHQIAELEHPGYLTRSARMAGRAVAQTLAYGIGFAIVYFNLKSHFHL